MILAEVVAGRSGMSRWERLKTRLIHEVTNKMLIAAEVKVAADGIIHNLDRVSSLMDVKHLVK